MREISRNMCYLIEKEKLELSLTNDSELVPDSQFIVFYLALNWHLWHLLRA